MAALNRQRYCAVSHGDVAERTINRNTLVKSVVLFSFGMALEQSYGLRRKFFDASFLFCLSIGALYAGARTGLTPKDPAQGVAVIFAPWTSANQAFSQAVATGGRFVRFGALPFVAVVIPDDAAYPERMFGAGAWLVVNAQGPGGCSGANASARKIS
jgi:hypothetical protein